MEGTRAGDSSEGETVKSDQKLFSIIEYLTEHGESGVTEIATDLGMAKSTVHLHLNTLLDSGYAVKNGTQYDLSLKFLDIGITKKNRIGIHKDIEPKMEEIAEKSGEQVWFWVEENGKAVVLSKAFGEHALITDGRIGKYMGLHCTAGGKALLANMPEWHVEEIIEQHGLPAQTSNTITEPENLFSELEEIRETGLAFSEEENIRGVNAIAAAIMDNDGTVHGSISVSGPSTRVDASVDTEEAELLQEVTKELGINLSYV